MKDIHAPARGIKNGIIIGAVMWVAIILVAKSACGG